MSCYHCAGWWWWCNGVGDVSLAHFRAPQSPDLNPIEHLWDVVERELRVLDVHPTNLHQLLDAILSIWANISKECFQHLVE